PSPSPLEAPATRPAMSTNSITVGSTFWGFTMSASWARRGSGTGTTPTLGSMVQKGKLAAAIPAFVSALNRVDLPTFGRPTMPHLMPMCSSVLRRVQPGHGVHEIALHRQRQCVQGVVDGAVDQDLVLCRSPAEHPGGNPVLVAGVADADAQAVEAAMAQQAHGVAQAVLPTVAAIELEAGRAGRQVQLVVREHRLLRRDLPELQRGQH